MKLKVISALAVLTGFALSGHGNILVNDTWLDTTRTDPNSAATPPYAENNGVIGTDGDTDGNLESAWFNSGGAMTPTAGHLTTTVPAGSASWTTYFTPEATPVTLSSQGDQIKVTWVFTPTGINHGGAADTGIGFRTALVNVGSAERRTTDGSPIDSAYTGYRLSFNVSPTLPANALQLRERATPSTIGNLLVNDGQWTAVEANGGTTGAAGMANGTQYTYTFSLTRNASDGLDIAASIAGGTINDTGLLSLSFTDTSTNGGSFTFDTFAMRPGSQAATADQFDTTLVMVEYIPVPEPSVFALSGMALLGLAAVRRNLRR